MGIRIQPREIEIPAADPFKYDLLDRKEPISVLTHIIRSIEGPCVLAVDAPWGAGKTTFLKIWEQHLRNEKFPIISFNAWETDFSDDPFIALSAAISQELEHYREGSLGDRIKHFKTLASAVVRVTAPAVIKVSTGGLVDVTSLMDLLKENPQAVASKTSDRLAAYEKAQELLNDLSIALLDVARDLAKSKNGLPLVIVIDELDRCRPSYAVELLEAAKHIFAVDKIVFVLAVNRTELAHSVRALYGAKFDAIGYLNRFFDVDFQLPNPARTQFIETALEVTSINEYFQNMTYQHTNPYHPPFKELLEAFYGVPGISIRTIAQAIHRLGLALASERTYRPLFVLSTVVALIIRTVDLKLYQRFIRGESVDEEVVDSIYDRAEYADVHWRIKAHFDAAIIVAAWEMSDSYVAIDRITDSPLLARYRQMIEQQSQHEGPRTEDERHAYEVSRLVDLFSGQSVGFVHLRFNDAVQRLELLSSEFTSEPELLT